MTDYLKKIRVYLIFLLSCNTIDMMIRFLLNHFDGFPCKQDLTDNCFEEHDYYEIMQDKTSTDTLASLESGRLKKLVLSQLPNTDQLVKGEQKKVTSCHGVLFERSAKSGLIMNKGWIRPT